MEKRVCSSGPLSSSNWSCLPKDLFDLIVDNLVFVSDIIRLGTVCKAWNSIALDHKEKLKRLINHPWQLVNSIQLKLLDFTNHEFSKFQLHNPFNKRKICYGSSYGWLVFEKNCLQLIVFNPFSGKIIDLPLIDREGIRYSILQKVVLSRDPSLGSFEVLAYFETEYGTEYDAIAEFAHLKFGDKFWTYLAKYPKTATLHDIIFYDKWILGVSNKGRILSLKIDHDIGCINFKEETVLPSYSKGLIGYCRIRFVSYLVETANGDLLIACRCVEDFSPAYKVYKLKHSNGEFECIRVKNLGDHSLFLGHNRCLSVLASNYPGHRANTIYNSYVVMQPGEYIYRVEEFHLDDKKLIGNAKENKGLCYESSWIVPSMNF